MKAIYLLLLAVGAAFALGLAGMSPRWSFDWAFFACVAVTLLVAVVLEQE